MKSHLIETTGRPMPAICFGMPAMALLLPSDGSGLGSNCQGSGFGGSGFEGGGLEGVALEGTGLESTGLESTGFGGSGFGFGATGFGGGDLSFDGTALDAIHVKSGVTSVPTSWSSMRDMLRATSAFVAAAAANQGSDYAAGAKNPEKNTEQAEQPQYYARRAFRGPDPWRERT